MAKLPSLITNELTGEALNYYGSDRNWAVEFKQTFEVIKNDNFTWTIKSALYIKIPSTYTSGGQNIGTCFLKIGNQRYDVQDVQIMVSGIWVRGSQISNNPYEWTKILEKTNSYECTTGRRAVRLYCGYVNSSGSEVYFSDYTLIYSTFPSFSGAWYQKDNTVYAAMPWIKVNGEWKRALSYKKINGKWVQSNQVWKWNPEG